MRPGDLVCIGYSGGTASTSLVHLLKVILYSGGTASTSLVHLLKVILYYVYLMSSYYISCLSTQGNIV